MSYFEGSWHDAELNCRARDKRLAEQANDREATQQELGAAAEAEMEQLTPQQLDEEFNKWLVRVFYGGRP